MTIQTDINQKDWTAFTRHVVRKSRKRWAPVYYIFVMVDRNAGIIVPRRSFATDAEREQFVSEVQGRSRGLAI